MKKCVFFLILTYLLILFSHCSFEKNNPEQKQFTKSDSLLSLVSVARETNADSLYYKASFLAAKLLDTGKALQYIDSALRINPTNSQYLFLKGYYLYSLGHFSKASFYLKKASEKDSLNPQILFYYGGCLLALEQYEKAFASFQKSIQLDPYNPDYLFSCGFALYKMRKLQDAKNYFLAALQIDSLHTRALYLLVDSYFRSNHPDSAEIWIQKLIRQDPNHPIGRFQLGNIERDKALKAIRQHNYVLAKKHLQNALEHYTYALEKDSSFAEAYYRRGYTFFELGQYQEALKDFKKAIWHNSEDYRAYFMIGSIYEHYGEKNTALTFYRKSLLIKPDFEDAQKAILEITLTTNKNN